MARISTTATTQIGAPRDWFFLWFLSVELPRIMHRYAILPGVVATTDQTALMYVPGASRVIHLSDGSTSLEQVTSCDPPNEVIYRVSELTSMFRYLVAEALGEIRFHDTPTGGTAVEWRYTFIARNWGAALVLQPAISFLWSGYMRSALSLAKQLAEAEAPKRSP